MEKMDSSDDKDKFKGAIRVEDVVVDDVASSTKQDELKNWLPHIMKWSFCQMMKQTNKSYTQTLVHWIYTSVVVDVMEERCIVG